MRTEVGILSKLKHSCIVTFLGVCVRPRLLVLMELAPLGSLRKELDRRGTPVKDDIVDTMIFSKDLTFKIIFQVNWLCDLFFIHLYFFFKSKYK